MRLFICDPVCAQPFGHNVAALNYFSNAFSDVFEEIVPLCCKHLPEKTVDEYGFVPFYDFYYREYISIATAPKLGAESASGFADPLEAQATRDAKRLIQSYGIDNTDTLFFPSLDIYGVVGLLNALAEQPIARQPKIFLRFIGVMENASRTYRDPERELLRRLVIARAAGARIALSAETPKLADRLAALLCAPVAVTPYPTIATAFPFPPAGPMICFCPGSARYDKGFLLLRELFLSIRQRDPDLAIQFVVQNLPDRDAVHHDGYISQLYAMPGVELLSSMISEREMIRHYRNASVILLPYDHIVYELRGSAALMEAACFGRPVISLDRMAFSEQIRYYGLGTVCSSLEEMANAVIGLEQEDREHVAQRALQARHRLTADMDGSYERWFRVAL